MTPGELRVDVPAGLPVQTANVVVTLPGSSVADQHVSSIYYKAITLTSPASFQPVQQVVVANFGDSTITLLNSATNQSVADPVPVGVNPISIGMAPDSEYALVLSFAPSMLHRRSILRYEDRPPFTTLGAQSGQTGALEVRNSSGLEGGYPSAFAWSTDGVAPTLSTHLTSTGVPAISGSGPPFRPSRRSHWPWTRRASMRMASRSPPAAAHSTYSRCRGRPPTTPLW